MALVIYVMNDLCFKNGDTFLTLMKYMMELLNYLTMNLVKMNFMIF